MATFTALVRIIFAIQSLIARLGEIFIFLIYNRNSEYVLASAVVVRAGCDATLAVTLLTAVSMIWNTLSSSTGVETLLFKVYLLRVPSFTDTVTEGKGLPPSDSHSSIT